MKNLFLSVTCILMAGFLGPLGVASPAIHYQARLADTQGVPLDGPVDVTFRVFTGATEGTKIWEETHSGVDLSDGRLSVLLGSVVPFPETLTQEPERWLEITVGDDTLEPRLQFASVPFALEADRLDGLDASAFEVSGTAATLQNSLVTSDETPPNQGGLVHWDNLLGVPAGFADGIDEGGTAQDHGTLTGLEDDDHPQYLLKLEAATGDGDVPNAGSNLVHWENLVGVPDGFADGEDAVFQGGGILSADIVDSTLVEADIAPGSLTGQSIAPGSLTGTHIAFETLSGSHIQDDSIWSADILNKSITAADIKDGAIGEAQLADGAVGGAKIAAGSIDTSHVSFEVGDIQEVIAGPGLSGGGESGDVFLSVGEGPGIDVQGQSVGLAPSYVSGSAYDNRFVKRSTPSFNSFSGVVAVSGAVFRPVTATGKYSSHSSGYIFVDGTDNSGAEDRFTAPIQLPHGGTVTSMSATYWDDSSSTVDIGLWRASQDGSSSNKIAGISSSGSGESAAWVTGQDATITQASIDNVEFVFWLDVDFPSIPQDDALRVLSVRVHYTITAPY